MKRWVLIGALCLVAKLFSAPAQVMIIRHAEKESGGDTRELIPKGWERAGAFTYYFTQTKELLTYGPPAAIFGAKKSAKYDNSLRIVQTATPIADYLKLPINLDYSEKEPEKIAKFILSNPDYEGKNILIVWHKEGIPCLIEGFGYKAPACADRFDLTYVLTFPAEPESEAIRYAQELMYGDSSHLPFYGTFRSRCPSTKCR